MLTTLVIIALIIVFIVFLYNSLIAKKNQVENIFGSVDAVLKKRYDLIPNLVASVKQYMEFEKGTLEKVTSLRSSALKEKNPDKKIQLNNEISKALGSIMIAVESYPELKSSTNMLQLQQSLAETEGQISAARRAYNQAVTDYNNALEQIPTNFIANFLRYQPKEVLKIHQHERENVNVGNLFKN